MKRVLVTGGAGFIGSNLIKKLLSIKGYHVTCIDNFDSFYSRRQKELNIKCFLNDPNFDLMEGDICMPGDLEVLGKIDIIVHLAAKAGVRLSIQDPFLYQNVNVGGTHTLLEFARSRNIKQFLFASSSSVYGKNSNVPWKEDDKLLPISPYASSKLSAEMLGHVYSHLYKIRFISLRFFTVYGPAQRPDLAIHKFFDCIMQNKPLPVYGDGLTARDYTYVGDIINGIIAAMNYIASDFEIINIGNNRTVTLNSLIRSIETICEFKAILKHCPEQAGDVPLTCADITKAGNLLDYHPGTSLMIGLDDFFNWYKANKCLLNTY